MKICNRKLAARIEENEVAIRNLCVRLTTAEAAPHIRAFREKIEADKATLAAHGYDVEGRRVARGGR